MQDACIMHQLQSRAPRPDSWSIPDSPPTSNDPRMPRSATGLDHSRSPEKLVGHVATQSFWRPDHAQNQAATQLPNFRQVRVPHRIEDPTTRKCELDLRIGRRVQLDYGAVSGT